MGDCACVLNSHNFFPVNTKTSFVFLKFTQLLSRKYFRPYGMCLSTSTSTSTNALISQVLESTIKHHKKVLKALLSTSTKVLEPNSGWYGWAQNRKIYFCTSG